MEAAGIEPSSAACKAGALPVELPPRVDADGWSRTTTARGNGFTDRRSSPGAQRPQVLAMQVCLFTALSSGSFNLR